PGGGQRTFRSSGHCLGIGYRTSVGPHAVRRTRRRGGDPDHGRGRVAVGSARNARGEPAPWAHRHGDVGVSHHTPVARVAAVCPGGALGPVHSSRSRPGPGRPDPTGRGSVVVAQDGTVRRAPGPGGRPALPASLRAAVVALPIAPVPASLALGSELEPLPQMVADPLDGLSLRPEDAVSTRGNTAVVKAMATYGKAPTSFWVCDPVCVPGPEHHSSTSDTFLPTEDGSFATKWREEHSGP